ncbi:chromate efflux transporter [Paracoccus sp. DMF-8]|uniref:chromate efflux transporter n=1 Tax=Paracoccus sp. DMF-8 TaxID=3019445 RepID=UPI0023E8558E|nr:chromate efflux transporter [Paracoccus sp. DMF-8]MDF3606778.1 chromate efflux transporter [Paracoccus sp. DMF-8]
MSPATPQTGTFAEVFRAFLKLGLTSFGGPIAHLGFFRDELIARRKWLSDSDYADLVALCQFLPGPTSSQVGFALGLMRAGWRGALAAFVGFTLPSALMLTALALAASRFQALPDSGVLQGLKIVAVAVVAQAVLGMARSLCPDAPRAGIAVAALVVLALMPGAFAMLAVIVLGGAAGLVLCRATPQEPALAAFPVSRRAGGAALLAFVAGFVLLPLLAPLGHGLAMIDGFFRAGSLVFGGGHVVLPLLQAETVAQGRVAPDLFLAGYGLAQAVPGPLFTFAAWLGAVGDLPPNGIAGAVVALLALFAPGFLLLVAAFPFWSALRRQPRAQNVMQGANAAVVGVLALALYDPVFTSAIKGKPDFALAVLCFVALTAFRLPPWVVVLAGGLAGVALPVAA